MNKILLWIGGVNLLLEVDGNCVIGRAELDRVADQVDEDLLHPILI